MRATPPPDTRALGNPGELQGIVVAANLPLDHPIVAEFLRSGKLSVDWGGRILRLDAGPEDRSDLDSLWYDCAGPPEAEPLRPLRIMEAPERLKTT